MNLDKNESCCAPVGGKSGQLFLFLGVILGLVAGWLHLPFLYQLAEILADLFVNFLKLVSLPIIFLSIVATATGMDGLDEIKRIGKKVLFYTLLTTLLAATLAFALFLFLEPVQSTSHLSTAPKQEQLNYLNYLMKLVPSNIVQPFYENHVIGVLILALLTSLSSLSIPKENRKTLHNIFHSLYLSVMKMCQVLLRFVPLAIFAFITLFFRDVQNGLEIKNLFWYLTAVLLANLIQACIILPLLLKARGLSPLALAKAMSPALSVAFFSKSSSAALPMAMQSARERAQIEEKVANFSLPLCTTINMNACAAFIYLTVLFVAMSSGVTFSFLEMIAWIFLATLAAVGNAGVPMGCYFLSSALLASMNVPLTLMGVILPFYSFIDMLESAINVWSDACVTACVDKDLQESPSPLEEEPVAL